MNLNLDPRQRAMLREMGVRVWLPEATPEALHSAIEIIAEDTYVASGKVYFNVENQPIKALAAPATPASAAGSVASVGLRKAPLSPQRCEPAPAGQPPLAGAQATGPASWTLGDIQPLYQPTAQPGGASWLVLAEAPATALHTPAFTGDAGKLLDNMLRAARLHQAGAVLYAPLVRQTAAAQTPVFSAALAALLERARPDVVLVMGRMAAQAVLVSSEPFGRLRGRQQTLHGVSVIATYDATYLLRAPADKAKAWADLCLAISLVQGV